MFFVFNKRKMSSYLISIGTVAMLFAVALFANNNNNSVVATSTANINNAPICKIETEIKKVSISINCSENVENIEEILSILEKKNSKATFFVSGGIVTQNQETIKKISNSGNEIGNLSYHYTNLKNKKDDELKGEILNCTNAIEQITGQKVKLFRVPYGEYNNQILKEATSQGLVTVQWNLDSLDYNGLNNEEMWERIEETLTPGSIILLHNSAKYTTQSLEYIISNIQEQGYQLVTISDLMTLQN